MDDEDFLKKIENYIEDKQPSLNKQCNINGHLMDKEQLFQCLKIYMDKKNKNNNKESSKDISNNNDKPKQSNDTSKYQINKATIDKTVSVSHQPACLNNNEDSSNNVDNIPLQQKPINFNKLVEEQLVKDNFEPQENITKEIKFKYNKKPKNNDKYQLRDSNNNKKYKYYTDNFQSNKEQTKEDNYNHPKKKIPKEIINNTVQNDKEINKDINEDNNTFLAFSAIKQVSALTKKNNPNLTQQMNVILDIQNKISTDQTYNLKDEEEENAIHKILTQQIPTKQVNNNTLTDNDDYYDLNSHSNHNEDEDEEDKEKEAKINDQIDELLDNNTNFAINEDNDDDDDIDNRDIYRIFSDNMHENTPSIITNSNISIKQQQKKQIPKPSKIISKYFNNTPINKATSKDKNFTKQSASTKMIQIPKKPPLNNNKSYYNFQGKEKVNELVKEKLEEVNKMTEMIKQETIKISQLKKQYETYISKLQLESDEYEKKKIEDSQLFQKEKEEQIAKLERDRKIQLNNTNLLENLPNKKDREEIDNLKEQILKLHYEKREKEQKDLMALQRIKKQLDDAIKKHSTLTNEIKVYEDIKENKTERLSLDASISKGILANVITESVINTKQSIDILNTNELNNPFDNNDDNNQSLIDDDYKEINEMIFLEKYHSHEINNEPCLQQETTHDGKIINTYSHRKEIIFPSGMRKVVYEDNYQITYFHNNDIKQLYPNGKEVYLYAESNIVQTKIPNRMIVFRFANGSIEQIFPDGTKITIDSNGNKEVIDSQGKDKSLTNEIQMGNLANGLTPEDLTRLRKETNLRQKDIKKIYRKYAGLDKDKKGYVSINDIIKIPEIEQNPLRFYIGQYLSNQNENEEVNFEAFIKIIDVFKNNKTEEQYKFMFNLFDFDKDGKISSEDMLLNFKLLLGNSLNEEQISEIVEKTISEYSNDQKYINYEEFIKILNED